MEEPNELFVFGQMETNIRLSHKLLFAFNGKHHSLESQFICLSCYGISINPLFCKICGYSYCQLCLLVLLEFNVRCLCKKRSKANFESQLDHELLKTKYWVQDQSSISEDVQITYLEASSYTTGSPYNFLSIDYYSLSKKGKENYNRDFQKINKHLTIHKKKFHCQFALKNARLINFHYVKGYALKKYNRIFCIYDAIFIGVLHLREIEFSPCLFNLDFSLSFCKSIRFNVKRIENFHISQYMDYHCDFENDFKSYFIILNDIQFCSKIKYLKFYPQFYESESTILFPKSFYNFLSTFYVLKTIFFRNLILDDGMNFNSFKSLISLQTLQLENCCFQNKILFYCFLDNIPNLNELKLQQNTIKCNSNNSYIKEENFKLKKTLKFPPILRIEVLNDNCMEKSIFQDLIQFDKIKMKYLQIDLLKNPQIPNFIDFIKRSNLQFWKIYFLKEVEGCNLDEFCNFLRNSQFLIGLGLIAMELNNSDYCLLLQAISFNKSIKVFSFLYNIHLSNCSFDLINLILTNKYITTIILYDCEIKIDLDFIEVLSKNKTLLYLDLGRNEINEEHASKLSNINLKGINVDYCGISKEGKDLIYQKIHRKEFPEDLLPYENFSFQIN